MVYLIAVLAFFFAAFLGFARGLGVIDWGNFWFWLLATVVLMLLAMRAIVRQAREPEKVSCSVQVGGYQPLKTSSRPVPPQGGSGLVRDGYVREGYQIAERPPDPPPMRARPRKG